MDLSDHVVASISVYILFLGFWLNCEIDLNLMNYSDWFRWYWWDQVLLVFSKDSDRGLCKRS